MCSDQEPEYAHMRSFGCLESLRDATRWRVGKEVGNVGVLWAESFAIQVVCNELRMCVLIFDDDVEDVGDPTSYVSVSPEADEGIEKYVILQRTRERHYDLITRDSSMSWTQADLPEKVKERWGLCKKTSSPEGSGGDEARIWSRLSRILSDPQCRSKPSGPSKAENRLLSRVEEFGVSPYK